LNGRWGSSRWISAARHCCCCLGDEKKF
jgi:hypothetical protein